MGSFDERVSGDDEFVDPHTPSGRCVITAISGEQITEFECDFMTSVGNAIHRVCEATKWTKTKIQIIHAVRTLDNPWLMLSELTWQGDSGAEQVLPLTAVNLDCDGHEDDMGTTG